MIENTKILQLLYTFFLGLLLAIFIGVGVSTFYVAPVAPDFPAELNTYGKEFNEKQIEVQMAYDKKMDDFNKSEMGTYNRNVSIIALSAAVLLLAISMFLEKKNIEVIADGTMLGGLFTLLYGLGRGFASQDSKYSFIAVSIGLILVLYLGYHRFVKKHVGAYTVGRDQSR